MKQKPIHKQQKDIAEPQPKTPIRYKHMTIEILFTDGQVKTATFYDLKDLLNYIEQTVAICYTDSIRIELF